VNYHKKYYLLCFLYVFAVSFTKTSYTPYLVARHLSLYDIHLVYAVFNICVMIFEIPSAGVGEWIGPKKSFLIGCLCKCIAAVIFFQGKNVYHFYAAEVVSAIAVAFISGSLGAWLMNRLSLRQEDKDVAYIFTIGDRVSGLALAFGGTLGAYLAQINIGYPWLAVGAGFVITFVLGLFILTEQEYTPGWKAKKVYQRWQWETLWHGYQLSLRSQVLLVLVFNCFVVSFALASVKMNWLYSLMEFFDLQMVAVGNIWFCIGMIQFLGTFGVSSLLKLTGSALRLKLVFCIFSVLMLLGVVLSKNFIVGYVIFYFLKAIESRNK
jgi:MFS family permease